ncbi:M50 family metallopeptidase [Paenibacillus lemnae]|uniref:M50 family metallopeptidase n=1 Tax=Paenibacillus lemnae TaxID=1330551 RepID=A0A848MCI9_PAELE|nr:M50 family metallopeptidase [Paenibacillus lemnae]NMO97154.1 M50 family metallopeptidase [Paenibacillus lemnae]
MNKWLKTILYLVGAAILTRLIPFSSWFRIMDTMIHELGHALATLLLSGRVLSIQLNPDHSGVTYSLVAPGWRSLIVSLAGYIPASLFSVLMFYGYARRKQAQGLIAIAVTALLMILLFVRNGYGIWWLSIFIVITLVFYLLGGRIRNAYYLVLAFLCLEESVMGPVTLLVYGITRPARAGDAANLASQTPLPAAVWALVFLAFALWCAKLALQLFWSRRSTASREREMRARVR